MGECIDCIKPTEASFIARVFPGYINEKGHVILDNNSLKKLVVIDYEDFIKVINVGKPLVAFEVTDISKKKE